MTDTTKPPADLLVVATTATGVRLRAARTTLLCQEAKTRHQLSPLAAHALSRALTCGALFPALEKSTFADAEPPRVSLQWSGRGPLRSLFVERRGEGDLRGYVREPQAQLFGRDPRARTLGLGLVPDLGGDDSEPAGFLSVGQLDARGRFSQGQVPLQNGELDVDLENWFTQSAQVVTRLATSVELDDAGNVLAAGGVLAQLLPGADKIALAALRLPDIEDAVRAGADGAELLAGFKDARVLEELEPALRCPCSRERALGGIRLLEADEILDMIAKDHGASVRCDFCSNVFEFDAGALLEILDERGAGGLPQ